jgi:hypothetical protein
MEHTPTDHLSMPLQIDDVSAGYLRETAKWGKFLSIVGFVVTGLIVLIALFAGSLFAKLAAFSANGQSALPEGLSIFITIIYLAIAVLYFFPCFYLFKFSNKAKLAIEVNEQVSLNEAFGNLKSCFKFIGITTIILLAVYGLALVAVVIVGVSGVAR